MTRRRPMKSPKQATAQQVDGEWERLCRAAAEANAIDGDPGVPPPAVRARALEAWRSSLVRSSKTRRTLRDLVLMGGVYLAMNLFD
jgi:hypothetical protein